VLRGWTILHRKDINAGIHGAIWRFDMGDDSPVTIALELIKARPMVGEVGRFKKEDLYGRSLRIEDQSWIAEGRAPSGLRESSPDRALTPIALQPGQFVMIDPAGR